jgi:hypothetical protein
MYTTFSLSFNINSFFSCSLCSSRLSRSIYLTCSPKFLSSFFFSSSNCFVFSSNSWTISSVICFCIHIFVYKFYFFSNKKSLLSTIPPYHQIRFRVCRLSCLLYAVEVLWSSPPWWLATHGFCAKALLFLIAATPDLCVLLWLLTIVL